MKNEYKGMCVVKYFGTVIWYSKVTQKSYDFGTAKLYKSHMTLAQQSYTKVTWLWHSKVTQCNTKNHIMEMERFQETETEIERKTVNYEKWKPRKLRIKIRIEKESKRMEKLVK